MDERRNNLGNPRLYKGCPPLNPAGRPKGSTNVKNLLKVTNRLNEKHRRHPVDELVNLADQLKVDRKFEEAADIWRDLLRYMEPQKKAQEVLPEKPETPQDSLENAAKLLEEMEQIASGQPRANNDTTAESGNPAGLADGAVEVEAKASPEADLRHDQGQQGAN